jgi:Arc/MetJ family transcription regulator
MSRTNVVLDDAIIENCMKITGIKTKKSVIDFALRELIRKDKQKKILQLQGNINWDGDLQQMRQARFPDE